VKYQHIIWDWNGTVINDVKLCVRILNEALTYEKLPSITISNYRKNFSFPVNLFYKSLGLPSSGFNYKALNTFFISRYKSDFLECNLHTGVQSILAVINNFGVNQSILSAGKDSDIKEFVNYHDLNKYFSFISGVRNIRAAGKKEIAKTHLDKIALEPNKILLVGDTVHDFEIADYLGIDCILFSNGHNSEDVLLGKTSRVITNYKILESYLF
jgi:phosphoglycolate phosphatase